MPLTDKARSSNGARGRYFIKPQDNYYATFKARAVAEVSWNNIDRRCYDSYTDSIYDIAGDYQVDSRLKHKAKPRFRKISAIAMAIERGYY